MSYSQILEDLPKAMFDQYIINGGIGIPTVDEIYTSYHDLMSNPDTNLVKDKIKAQRWMAYSLPRYNITGSDQYNLSDYTEAMKSI